jgi:hydroxymethylbilane synthase
LIMRKVVIGTRGSKLALRQTEWVRFRLEAAHPGIEVHIKLITTRGDRATDISLPKLGEQGKGLFTKELEEEMLAGLIDLAVHSLKDLPTELPQGLHIGAICERQEPRDALIARPGINSFQGLPEGARIGTSSLRRKVQALALRPDLRLEAARGNVDTRLRKLDQGLYDAMILAAAGLIRLGLQDRLTELLSPQIMLPAIGQGALAIETRRDDEKINQLVRALDHAETRLACQAERAFLAELGGGCLVPIAALAWIEGDWLKLDGLVASPDGSKIVRGQRSGPTPEAETIGKQLAEELLGRGAKELLSAARPHP